MAHRHHSRWRTRLAGPIGLLALALGGGLAPAEAANSGFVTASGGQFVLNGRSLRFASTNAYFMVDAGSDGSIRHTDDMISVAQELGFTVLRTWGFLDGTSAGAGLQPSAGVYDESAFRALDYVLHRADQANIRLLIALVNYWSDYGGMPQYLQWCAPGQGINAFYTNASCKQLYKNYVSYVLNRVNTYNGRRYKDDPTILGWELANEPRSTDPTGNIVTQWTAEMAAFVKSIDGNHMVGLGEEGFDTTSSGYSALSSYNNQAWLFDGTAGISFTNNTALPQIDFASIHVYPDGWNLPAEAGSTWIRDHARKARQLGKPLLIGEFGYQQSPWGVMGPWMDTFEAEQVGGALIWEIICASVCANYGGSLATAYPPSSEVAAGMAQAEGRAKAGAGTVAPTAPPPPPDAAGFTLGATVSPNPVSTGQAATVTARVTAGAPASDVVVDVEIYDAANVKVGQQIYAGQSFASAGETRSYTWSWPGTTGTGQHSVRVGVFSADWSTLHAWSSQAATFPVQTAVSAPTDFTLSATVTPSPVAPGQPATVTARVTAAAPASNVVVDIEIYDAAGVKVGQQLYTGQSFASAGSARSYTWSWPGTTGTGQHTVRIGVFSADWSTLYEWSSQAATFSVQAGASASVTVAATASPTPIRSGKTLTVKANVKSTIALPNARIDLEIHNAAGARVAQQVCTKSLAAGETKSCSWSYPVRLRAGTYTVKVGVFSSDWATLYRWVSPAATFVVK